MMNTKRKKIKKRIFMSIGIILLISGLVVLLYAPTLQFYNGIIFSNIADEFDKNIGEYKLNSKTEDEYSGKKEYKKPLTDQLLDQLYEDMKRYNEELYRNGRTNIKDPYIYEQPSFDLSKYGVKNNIFGYIYSPNVKMKLPVYLGASWENMDKGAGCLDGTSMPIGGENTNCAISAHRAYIDKIMFDNIVDLKVGDDVYIRNFWDNLHYKVTGYAVVDPYDSSLLTIEPGKDKLTLITCHPYGQSFQRYIVFCERA